MDVAKECMKFVGARKDDTVAGWKEMSDPRRPPLKDRDPSGFE